MAKWPWKVTKWKSNMSSSQKKLCFYRDTVHFRDCWRKSKIVHCRIWKNQSFAVAFHTTFVWFPVTVLIHWISWFGQHHGWQIQSLSATALANICFSKFISNCLVKVDIFCTYSSDFKIPPKMEPHTGMTHLTLKSYIYIYIDYRHVFFLKFHL